MESFHDFIKRVEDLVKKDDRIIAIGLAGSWITNEIDKYSDIDFVLITNNDITFSKEDMINFANNIGNYVIGFTGEHVGENKLLICLFNNPVTHIDLKFIQINDFFVRVENPVIIYEKSNIIENIYLETKPFWPKPDFQWIEDRFWVWIHYAATKLGRHEFFETIDFISFLRQTVIGPLYHIKYKKDPRGVRKLEFFLDKNDLLMLEKTISNYSFDSIKESIFSIITIYRDLRSNLFNHSIKLNKEAESICINYLSSIQ